MILLILNTNMDELGVLVNGFCTCPSQFNPNVKLKIKDELTLWEDKLWSNDKVFTSDGKMIIGNKFSIPYKFDKMA